jgi:hypothetical protein|tara:strand:+ start:6589 stop:6717 length:129 start_codon:yes stop_codon:yes gene_type:complete
MKIKIILNSGGEFVDINFIDPPIHIPMDVEIVHKDDVETEEE